MSEDGLSVTGNGEPGATVVIKDDKGDELATGTVDEDGNFTVELDSPTDGSDITVGLVGEAGNKSEEVIVPTPDKVAPEAPTNLSVGSDGKSVSGKGEPGAKVVIKNNKGQEIATGTVNSDGSFKVNLKNPTDGSDIKVGLVDGAGNKSPEVTKSTPDKVAPDAPTNLSVGSDGKSVSGKGEPGAKVVIKNNKGQEIATGTVNSDGSFKVNLKNPTDGSDVKVGLVDGAGNKSPEVTKSTPDKVAPDAPTNLSVGSDGKSVSGKGEPGAKVVIKNNKGQEIATGTVNSDGSFKVNLKNPTDGSDIKVGLVDGAGNKSPEVIKSTPDKVAPDAPTNLSVGSDGKSVSGKGEPGAKVVIKNNKGQEIATGTVNSDGSFKVNLKNPTDGSDIKVGLV
ncbi:hypothetical protein DC081_09605, partial [Ignatzschineria cameli]